MLLYVPFLEILPPGKPSAKVLFRMKLGRFAVLGACLFPYWFSPTKVGEGERFSFETPLEFSLELFSLFFGRCPVNAYFKISRWLRVL